MASKSKKRRKVLGASCILAALIIAGSSFAWFTSKDEVTNRLTANADYGVSIVESFTPPANWIPGQEVNKDVYATNTGNIGAFVREDISGALSIVKEVSVPMSDTGTSVTTHTITYNDGTSDVTITLSDADYTAKVSGTTYSDSGMDYIISADVTNNSTAVYDCVQLTDDERYAVEAGAYLAYLPAADTTNKVGDIVVAYKDATNPKTTYVYTAYKDSTHTQYVEFDAVQSLDDNADTAGAAFTAGYTKQVTKGGTNYFVKESDTPIEKKTSTDFTPRADGLYVFRRSIDVTTDGLAKGAESFTYDGYYYFGGRYYKIADLSVTPDTIADVAGDGKKTDGLLTNATANLVQEVTDHVDPVNLEYDNANHRLIATYGTAALGLDAALTAASQNLDDAEHEYAAAELALRRAIEDAASEDATVKTNTADRDAKLAARNTAKAEYDEAKAAFEALKQRYNEALAEFTPAKTTVGSDIESLVGTDASATIAIANDPTKTLVENATTNGTVAGLAGAYNTAVDNYNDFVADHTLNTGEIEHIYYTYLDELSNYFATYDIADAVFADPTNPTASELETEINRAVGLINYNDLVGYTPAGAAEIHQYHELLTAKKLAEDNYEKALQKYVDDVAKLNNIINTLNSAGTNGTLSTVNTTAAKKASDITGLDAETGKLFDAVKTARNTYDGETTDVLNAAEGTGGKAGALATAEQNLLDAEVVLQNSVNNVVGNDNVKANLDAAWDRYYKAKNALSVAEKAESVAQAKYNKNDVLTIYINLANDVLVGGEAGKWQILPTTIGTDETAHFYYTSILGAGNTSSKLVESVELAGFVTEDMYKYFDFDLNIGMKSAQVTYDDAGNVLATAVDAGELGAGIKATIADPAHESTTALTWS